MAGRDTPAVTAARRAGIPHAIHEYAHDASRHAFGREAVEALGLPADRVFKTLVATVDGRLVIAVVPVDAQLNLKALAAALGGKHARLAEPATAERATGYVVGGISPLGTRRALTTVLDASALSFQTVFISAGRRGLELELSPANLVRLTGASTAPVSARNS